MGAPSEASGRRAAGGAPVRAVAIACALLAASGCYDGAQLELRDWSVVVDGRGHPTRLPANFDGDPVPQRAGRYRLETRIEIPVELRGRQLSLAIPFTVAPTTLEVDGYRVAGTETGRHRPVGPQVWPIPGAVLDDHAVEVSLAVDHSWNQTAWLGTAPRLLPTASTGTALRPYRVFNVYVPWAALMALVQIGLTCLLVYVVDRRRTPYLWFSIQALTAAYYPAFALGLTEFMGPAEYFGIAASLITAVYASLHFSHSFFHVGRLPRRWAAGFVVAMVAAAAAFDPFLISPFMATVVVVAVAGVIAYQAVLALRLLREFPDRASVVIMLAAWVGLLVLTGGSDMFVWVFGAGEPMGGVRTACVGLALFALLLSLLLSRSHVISLARADELNSKLATQINQLQVRGAEIEQLNAELRRQIAERSAQMYAVLALSGGEAAPVELEAGDIVQERYRVLQSIGAGGMGAVYEVERLSDGRRLALKVAQEVRGAALARLAREAQISSQAHDPHVVGIVDVDVSTDGFLFIVMELVEGNSLDKLRKRFGDVDWALAVLVQVASGLRALHTQGIVHRDLKPANVLVTGDVFTRPQVKLTDFGISRLGETDTDPIGKLVDASRLAGSSESVTREMADLSRLASDVATGSMVIRAAPSAPTQVPFASAGESTVVTALPVEAELSPEMMKSVILGERSSDSPSSRGKAAPGVESKKMVRVSVLDAGAPASESPGPISLAGLESTPPKNDVVDDLASESELTPDTGEMSIRSHTPRGRAAGSTGSDSVSNPSSLTRTGHILGTPAYMAPELTHGRQAVTTAVDMFALGVLAWELLTGERPFAGAVVIDRLNGREPRAADSILSKRPELHASIADAVDACLAFDPRTRPTAEGFVEVLSAQRDED